MVDSTQMGLGLGARVDEGQTIITERVRAKMPEAAAYVHEGKFITANRAYLKLFGLRKLQDLQGMTLLGMVPRTDQAALKSAMTLALKFSQVVHLEVTGMTNLGSLAAMEMFIAPTRINGEPCHKVFARLREGPKLVPHDIDKTLGDASIAGFVNVEAKDEEEVIVDTVSQRPAFKGILAQILTNHVLANLTFAIVLLMGIMAYFAMPRERDPVVNFNFINVVTFWGGASAEEIAKRVTTVLEDAIGEVSDVRFVSSSSREGVSNILVRFDELDDNTFDKRVSDLRRAIQNHQGELPPDAETPSVVEYTSSNSFPNAILVLSGAADDEVLRRQGEQIKADLERIRGTERVELVGLHSPELQVLFDPDRLESIGVDPSALANSITSYYQDISAGALDVSGERWLVRLVGIDSDPDYLAQIPVVTAQGEVTLGSLANVQRGRENPEQLARLDDRPAILVGVFKRGGANSLTLIEDVKNYIERRNQLVAQTGVSLLLVNDQTRVTTEAIAMMQNNSLMGLLLVFIVATLFLGWQIAFFTCIGIPFTIAGTFWLLSLLGMTLNVVVLLGVILSIGMLVDDAVVVVESIFYRLQRGMDSLRACVDALQEVSAPVLASVLTTMAAFLPLMMLPGILGSFMEVVPLVVIVALAVSLVEAYWMLPSHVIHANINFDRPTAITRFRALLLKRICNGYVRLLVWGLRYPLMVVLGAALVFGVALGGLLSGQVKFDFFANDPKRLFYVSIVMPSDTPLESTLAKVNEATAVIRERLNPGEERALVGFAGQMYKEDEARFGEHLGQVLVGLNPVEQGGRSVGAIIDGMRADLNALVGPESIAFLQISFGPTSSKPINLKVRGDAVDQLRGAVATLKAGMAEIEGVLDIGDNDSAGIGELRMRIDRDAVQRAGLDPAAVARTIRLLVDGEVVATVQEQGEEIDVRVKARRQEVSSLDDLLRFSLPLPNGERIVLAELIHQETMLSEETVMHYDYRRAISIEADIDPTQTDVVAVNNAIRALWEQERTQYPDVTLSFAGMFDDVTESLGAISTSFLLGLGLIYLILGTQFRSYLQPFFMFITVPTAFSGVVLGLMATGNPMSLYTLYGVVALAGIAVNSAIMFISSANMRREMGMSTLRATIAAARRRVVPILITSLTTIAGLLSLSLGIGGNSLVWGPVATAIVWGLAISTMVTLMLLPVLYRCFTGAIPVATPEFATH